MDMKKAMEEQNQSGGEIEIAGLQQENENNTNSLSTSEILVRNTSASKNEPTQISNETKLVQNTSRSSNLDAILDETQQRQQASAPSDHNQSLPVEETFDLSKVSIKTSFSSVDIQNFKNQISHNFEDLMSSYTPMLLNFIHEKELDKTASLKEDNDILKQELQDLRLKNKMLTDELESSKKDFLYQKMRADSNQVQKDSMEEEVLLLNKENSILQQLCNDLITRLEDMEQ